MDIKTAYQNALRSHGFSSDPAQEKVLDALAEIQTTLTEKNSNRFGTTNYLLSLFNNSKKPVSGLYLWGDVGRGKTWLMNLFIENLEIDNKIRLHFHHFMVGIHEKLATMPKQKNPLKIIAKEFAEKYRVLCLDEFIVTNITDAMLLNGLLTALFENGVTLVATSNRVPDDLYKNGLQRQRFLPAIELIKQHTTTINLDGKKDHRLELLESTNMYIHPVTGSTHQYLLKHFEQLATDKIITDKILTVLKRPIKTEYCADEIAWFNFNELCDAPRATPDYIELAQQFHTIFLSDIPVMDEYLDDKARRFIYLIDEMYDRRVKVIISADAPADKLYTGNLLKFAFNRTVSRLIEMRSESYISKSHQVI